MTTAIFDFNRTLYDPGTESVIPGAVEVLTALRKRKIRLILISRREAGRDDLVDRLSLRRFFENIVFVEDKTEKLFRDLAEAYRLSGGIYVIGDLVDEEIKFGILAGMKTIWFRVGKFANLEPASEKETPWETITDLKNVLDLIPL